MALLTASRPLEGDRPLEVVDATDVAAFTARLRAAIEGAGPALLPVLGPAPAEPHGPAGPTSRIVPDDIALVLATSGSTGVPKLVALSGRALTASTTAATKRLGAGAWMLALSPNYIAGINVLLRSAAAGHPPVQLPGGSFTAPAFLTAAAELTAGPRLVSLVPAQLATLLDDPDSAAVLGGFDAVLVGGQFTPAELLARATGLGIRVVRSYGSSETAGGCVYDGVPLDGVVLDVLDGEVLVGGPTLASGYLGEPKRTAEVFVERGGVRWFRTGDLGELDARGTLGVTGRVDDVIVSGGVNVSLAVVERAVRALPALSTAVVVAVPDQRWGEVPAVVADGRGQTTRPTLDAVRADLARAGLAPAQRPGALVWAEEGVPHLASGKPDRIRCAQLARAARDAGAD